MKAKSVPTADKKSVIPFSLFLKIIFALGLLYSFVVWKPPSQPIGLGGGWPMCIRFLEEGTLYGGQPFCAQPPLIYYYGLFLKSFFGVGFLENYASPATVVIGSAFTLFFMLRIMRKEGINDVFLFILAFVSTFYFNSLGHLEGVLCAMFFVAGVYCLLYERKPLSYASGILFAISFFFRYTVIMLVVVLLLYLLNPKRILRISDKSLCFAFSKEDVIVLLSNILPISSLALVFQLLYPNYLTYTYRAHTYFPAYTLSQTVHLFFDTSRHVLAFDAFVLIFAFLIYRRYFSDRIAVFALMVLIHSVFIVFNHSRALGGFSFPGWYNLPAMPFLILAILSVKNRSKALFFFLFAVVLLYPGLTTAHSGFDTPLDSVTRYVFEQQKNDFMRSIQYGLHFIPPQDGIVLTEGPPGYESIFSEYDTSIDIKNVKVVRETSESFENEDPFFAPRLRRLINVPYNYSQAYERLSPEEEKLRREIIGGRYSLIMFGPPQWAIIRRVITEDIVGQHCVVFVPNFQYFGEGLIHTIILFKNQDECLAFKSNMLRYYSQNFDRICLESKAAADVTTKTLSVNSMPTKKCTEGGNKEVFYSKGRDYLQTSDLIAVAILFTALYLYARNTPSV